MLPREDIQGDEGIQKLVSLYPLGRLGKPEEIARSVVFPVDDEFPTGPPRYIDGGYTA